MGSDLCAYVPLAPHQSSQVESLVVFVPREVQVFGWQTGGGGLQVGWALGTGWARHCHGWQLHGQTQLAHRRLAIQAVKLRGKITGQTCINNWSGKIMKVS